MFYKLIYWPLCALMVVTLGLPVIANLQYSWMVKVPIVSEKACQSLILIGSALFVLTLLVQNKCHSIACKKEEHSDSRKSKSFLGLIASILSGLHWR